MNSFVYLQFCLIECLFCCFVFSMAMSVFSCYKAKKNRRSHSAGKVYSIFVVFYTITYSLTILFVSNTQNIQESPCFETPQMINKKNKHNFPGESFQIEHTLISSIGKSSNKWINYTHMHVIEE